MGKKILKTMGIIFLVIIISGMAWFAWARQANSAKLDSNEKIYEASGNDGKTALLVYQKSRTSLAGNVADTMAKTIAEGGYQVTVNYPGDYLGTDLSGYDLVVLGSPIYMSGISSNLSNYMKSVENWGDAKVVYYRTGMLESSSDEEKAVDELLTDIPVAGTFKILQSDYNEDSTVAAEAIKAYMQ